MESAPIIRKMLEEVDLKYKNLLSFESPDDIDKVLRLLDSKKQAVKSQKNVRILENPEPLDENTLKILVLMNSFAQEIKQIFISNEGVLSHITTVSPEKLIGRKILKSPNRANNYETESGNWTFASSEQLDGKNLYVARKPNFGMICITPEVYIYGGDNLDVTKDENGNGKILLKEPNYAYIINPENFTPVVTLKRDRDGKSYFEFSEEWTSENDIDIMDSRQVSNVKEIIDVTEIIKNYQIFCDVNMERIAFKVRASKNIEEGIQLLRKYVLDGKLRYINGEANVNVHQIFSEIIPSLNIDMKLSEFEERKEQIIDRQNVLLQSLDLNKIKAYRLLVKYRETKNALELNGTFKKELALNKTPEEIEENRKKCQIKINEILQKARELFGENITEENLEDILSENSQDVVKIVQDCEIELKDAADEVGLILNSCIYVSPDKLEGGMLRKSKDVLNISGELGSWVFAQSGTLVDNPYLLRKSGKGVFAKENMCMPGDTELVTVKNGRAILSEPVYVYLMKTTKFNPVVSVDFLPDSGNPGIYFDGEWTSDEDISLDEMEVKSFSDVTEMLEYVQMFSATDKNTFLEIANMQRSNVTDGIIALIVEGKLHYINGECNINANEKLVEKCNMLKGKIAPDNR